MYLLAIIPVSTVIGCCQRRSKGLFGLGQDWITSFEVLILHYLHHSFSITTTFPLYS